MIAPINVGSDFSGVGAFEQSLKRLNINYQTIFACDIDKHARQTYLDNYDQPGYFPEDVYHRPIPKQPLDIYMTSPPCQAFSMAGKRKGEDDKRGVLFYNSHTFISINKPRYFIFENVKGLLSDDDGKTFQRWLDFLGGKSVNGNPVIFPLDQSTPYHIYYKVLNAKDFGVPQNRERVFIVGIRDDEDNSFNWPKPIHLTKTLKDVLEKKVDKKYFLKDKTIKGFLKSTDKENERGNGFGFKAKELNELSFSITTKEGNRKSDNFLKIPNIMLVGNIHPSGNGMNGNVFDSQGISPSLTTNKGEGIKIKSATKNGYEIATEDDSIDFSHLQSDTRRGRVGKKIAQNLDTYCNQAVMVGAIRGRGQNNEQNLELNTNGTSNSLTTVQKNNLLVCKNYLQYDASGKGHKSQQDRIYFENGVMCTIPVERTDTKVNVLLNDYRIRRLTPRECFNLMDFPQTFKWTVSDTQAYKQAGNSIVVACLAGIINQLHL